MRYKNIFQVNSTSVACTGMPVLGWKKIAYVAYMLQEKETVLYIAAFYFLISSLGKHKHMTSGKFIYLRYGAYSSSVSVW